MAVLASATASLEGVLIFGQAELCYGIRMSVFCIITYCWIPDPDIMLGFTCPQFHLNLFYVRVTLTLQIFHVT